jgi:hypothetical protein
MPRKSSSKPTATKVSGGKLRDIWDGLSAAQRRALVAELVESAKSGKVIRADADEAARHRRVIARLRANRGDRPQIEE